MMNDLFRETDLMMTRRQLFGRAALGLSTAALANALGPDLLANAPGRENDFVRVRAVLE